MPQFGARYHWRSGQQIVLTPENHHWKPERAANQTLVEAIAKAHRWQEQIESGEYAGIEDLAQALGVDRTYAGRLLRLTSLAPDIVEAILRGDEPDGISLTRLHSDLPACWADQRRRWN